MPIRVGQAFERTGGVPIDQDLVLSKLEMKAINDNKMPQNYFAICTDDGKMYTYDKNNTVDPTTGKFRVYEGGGSTDDVIERVQVLPTTGISDQKIYVTDEIEYQPDISDFGLAKIIPITLTTNGWESYELNIADLGLSSVNDYYVVVQRQLTDTAVNPKSGYAAWDKPASIATRAVVKIYQEESYANVPHYALIFAKGYSSGGGSGGSGGAQTLQEVLDRGNTAETNIILSSGNPDKMADYGNEASFETTTTNGQLTSTVMAEKYTLGHTGFSFDSQATVTDLEIDNVNPQSPSISLSTPMKGALNEALGTTEATDAEVTAMLTSVYGA